MRANERQALLEKLEPKNPPPNSKYAGDLLPNTKPSGVIPEQTNLNPPELKQVEINPEDAKAKSPNAVTSKIIPEDSKVLPPNVQASQLIDEQRKAAVDDIPDASKDLPEEAVASKVFTQQQSKFIGDAKASKIIPPEDRKSKIVPNPSNVQPGAVAFNVAAQPSGVVPKPSQIKQSTVRTPDIGAQTSFANPMGENIGTQTGESPSRIQTTIPQPIGLSTQPVVSQITNMPSKVVPQQPSTIPPPSGIAPIETTAQSPSGIKSFDAPQQSTGFPPAPNPIPSTAIGTQPLDMQPSGIPPEPSKVTPVQASKLINEEEKGMPMDLKSADRKSVV